MQDTWNELKLAEIESISGIGGRFQEPVSIHFFIFTKDGGTHKFEYPSHKEAVEKELEVKKLWVKYNNIPDNKTVRNDVFARINGQSVEVGYKVENNLGRYETISYLEAEKLKKEFRLIVPNTRWLTYIQVIEIKGVQVVDGDLDRWSDQLTALGYDVSLLQPLKEESSNEE
ncbi:hypothetical protein HSE3_gp115 [Bacillus phage vB_BceM-HSE3]|nr:hypothetical protein HSE3_gp115 [Bacillus phage vB_BceM-HSE3]